ncbi:MAG: NUDIX domain-containing protein [Terracoccus sp.]
MRTNVPGGVVVVGIDPSGRPVAEARLHHGRHPDGVLAAEGWAVGSVASAGLRHDGAIELTYRVTELDGIRPEGEPVDRDDDVAPGEEGEPHQRVAAYAVVSGAPGLLLTQFTSQTRVAGSWGLPGGGLDPGESPAQGLHREVWEETGQRVVLGDLVTVQSQHWVGRAPTGVLEDFHAVRIVYAATCPEPTEIVIHDVGGTTSDARWFRRHELADLPMSSSWRDLATVLGPAAGSLG